MPVVEVFDKAKNKVGEIELLSRVFEAEVKPHLIHDVIKMQLANRRRGTACTKSRGLVSGGGKKPWRQKGTGRARSGTIRSPLWKGGGTIFGPLPRDYSYKLPKKVRRSALTSALSQKLKEEKLIIVESIDFENIKTKQFVTMMGEFKINNALIIDKENRNLSLSARNVPAFKVLKPGGLNVYDILRYDYLMLTRLSLEQIISRLAV